MSKRAIVLYCLLVYAWGWSLEFGAIHFARNLDDLATAGPWLVAGMFGPALVALLFVWRSAAARALFRWRPSWQMLPKFVVAIAVPAATAFAAIAVCMRLGWGHSGWFTFSPAGVAISGGPWLLGRGVQGWPLFVANVAVTGFVFAAISGIAAAGEEFGWRGLLLGALVERLGITRGIALLGLIWSFWHLPILLAGYNYPAHPVLGALVLFPLTLVGASFFLGWLTLRCGSAWPAALAHGATNSLEVGVIGNIKLAVPQLYEDVLQVALTLMFGLAFWMLLRGWQNPRPMPAVPEPV